MMGLKTKGIAFAIPFILTVFKTYQNFHQGLVSLVGAFLLFVEVVPEPWPITLSLRLPFVSLPSLNQKSLQRLLPQLRHLGLQG